MAAEAGDAAAEEGAGDVTEEEVPATKVTLRLALQKSVTGAEAADIERLESDELLARAAALKTLHLEWLHIELIENLDAFEGVEVAYLQYNRIGRIEGLEGMPRLQFLALQHNRIACLENLRHLTELEFLDLTGNRIKELHEEELPQAINMLNLKGNPCADLPDYEERMLRRLPNLAVLDKRDVGVGSRERSLLESVGETRLPVELASGEQGLSAYWRKDELRTGLLSSCAKEIDAYSSEALADVDALGGHAERALERSRARQAEDKAAPGSLSEEQQAEVKRLSAILEERRAREAVETGLS